MVISLLNHVISNLNDFPTEHSICNTMSPATIVEGVPKPDLSYKRIAFGAYAIVWIRTSNDMKRRAVPAISLGQSNRKGGHYFMSLNTGKRIHSYHWDKLPIPDEVIDRVEELAKEESQPLLTDKQPMFEWSPGFPITSSITDDPDDGHTAPIDNSVDIDLDISAIDNTVNDDSSSVFEDAIADEDIFFDEHHLHNQNLHH